MAVRVCHIYFPHEPSAALAIHKPALIDVDGSAVIYAITHSNIRLKEEDVITC